MIPIISSLSIKLHALLNSRGLNCQFDSCSFVRANQFLKKKQKNRAFLIEETSHALLLVPLFLKRETMKPCNFVGLAKPLHTVQWYSGVCSGIVVWCNGSVSQFTAFAIAY